MNKKINILFIGNVGSSAWNFKKGLSCYKDINRIDLLFEKHPCNSGIPSKKLLSPNSYDVVVYSYPFIKTYFKYFKYLVNAKVIWYWRGTDVRGKDFSNPLVNFLYKKIHSIFFKYVTMHTGHHIYSTPDLGWWFRNCTQPNSYLPTLIDTDVFFAYNNYSRPIKKFVFSSGSRGYKRTKVKHDNMPKFLNKIKFAEVNPAFNIHPLIMSNLCAECLACGVKVKHHEDKNREWVINNRSIPVCSKKLHIIIKEITHK